MGISEKIAYLKGLMEGMKLDTETNEGKLLAAVVDLLLLMTGFMALAPWLGTHLACAASVNRTAGQTGRTAAAGARLHHRSGRDLRQLHPHVAES